jgi:hypothetical protein
MTTMRAAVIMRSVRPESRRGNRPGDQDDGGAQGGRVIAVVGGSKRLGPSVSHDKELPRQIGVCSFLSNTATVRDIHARIVAADVPSRLPGEVEAREKSTKGKHHDS